jgi:hypothetical protein
LILLLLLVAVLIGVLLILVDDESPIVFFNFSFGVVTAKGTAAATPLIILEQEIMGLCTASPNNTNSFTVSVYSTKPVVLACITGW